MNGCPSFPSACRLNPPVDASNTCCRASARIHRSVAARSTRLNVSHAGGIGRVSCRRPPLVAGSHARMPASSTNSTTRSSNASPVVMITPEEHAGRRDAPVEVRADVPVGCYGVLRVARDTRQGVRRDDGRLIPIQGASARRVDVPVYPFRDMRRTFVGFGVSARPRIERRHPHRRPVGAIVVRPALDDCAEMSRRVREKGVHRVGHR